ncbi:MAG: hypothetical protein AVDCRST_MAG13-1114, partial [uncultured Solirubrobacteraceae bacterium]
EAAQHAHRRHAGRGGPARRRPRGLSHRDRRAAAQHLVDARQGDLRRAGHRHADQAARPAARRDQRRARAGRRGAAGRGGRRRRRRRTHPGRDGRGVAGQHRVTRRPAAADHAL